MKVKEFDGWLELDNCIGTMKLTREFVKKEKNYIAQKILFILFILEILL